MNVPKLPENWHYLIGFVGSIPVVIGAQRADGLRLLAVVVDITKPPRWCVSLPHCPQHPMAPDSSMTNLEQSAIDADRFYPYPDWYNYLQWPDDTNPFPGEEKAVH